MKPVDLTAAGSLAGKHAMITGGSRGIGRAISLALVQAGVRVTIAARNDAGLQQCAADIGAQTGETVYTVQMDVCSAESVAAGFDAAAKAQGGIDILINNAGQAASAPVLVTDQQLWQQMLNVNLSSAFLCTQQVLPGMMDRRWGRIVNIASTAGLKAYPYVSAYVAAKHGLIGYTRAVALEIARSGITVNAVCPGFTDTAIVDEAIHNIVEKTGRSAEQARDSLAQHNPQRRLIQPEEVARCVLWLCEPAASAMTGQAITVAGGEWM
ncbi:SDR family NAD(P)-dependent oxidoreductase [Undibacterium crateris]|uniref:SDR family NAD(P)-dependent oxidoreductase n=1 Tax=Undibacterium crateris TaxID=2528175 RepID=UPI00138A170A|nr:SDR family NAD(P)-dependent oxidoreductase [Undibacterium crateris]NDI84133.1 SDR family NAD(P)-dependent oxidoreductase [Undibacterium crateris]